MMSEDSSNAVLGRIPSGIYILTVGSGDRATGLLASWVQQAGFEPPMISVAVKQGRFVADWISEGQPFVINILGESNSGSMKHFSRGFEPNENAFEGVEASHCPRGVPVLKDALGHLECELASSATSGDHHIFLAKVVRGILASDEKPMVHIRKNGANY